MDRLIHQSIFSLDRLYPYYGWLDRLAVNHYQLLTVLWNLILALVPLGLYWLLKKIWRRPGRGAGKKIALAALFLLWLLFFPNTAYIMTDVRHLIDYCPADSPNRVCAANAWMIMFFFFYSVFGWLSFYYTLKLMADFIGDIAKKISARLFIILAVPVTALGVLAGLLNRFNSLDAFLYPGQLARAGWAYFSQPDFFRDWLVFTVFLYLLYWLGETVFKKPGPVPPESA